MILDDLYFKLKEMILFLIQSGSNHPVLWSNVLNVFLSMTVSEGCIEKNWYDFYNNNSIVDLDIRAISSFLTNIPTLNDTVRVLLV